MPTYEYKCDACGHAFVKFHSITAAPVKKCPECGKNKVRRLISAGGGMIFKGSGFYITDYRSDSYESAKKADSGAPAESTAKTDSKADATKTEAAKDSAKPAESKTSENKTAETKSAEPSKPAPVAAAAPQAKSSSAKATSNSNKSSKSKK